MCGISGIIHYQSKGNEQDLVQRSVAAMPYRGPDNADRYHDDVASLGHVRLSIIDLDPRSHQPFHSQCGRYVIVYNGEAYNFQVVRDRMEQEGFHFRSTSDTEVILEGYIRMGPQILQHLRGMWAFVIWDKQEQKAFMARDRFGEKPFYYKWEADRQRFSFASNLAAIRPLIDTELQIDPVAVRQLFNYQYIVQDTCIYKGIQKLPQAHYAILSKDGLEMHAYWQLDYRNKHGKGHDAIKKEARDLIMDSIQGQLIADVPVGLFLSGGVDSGIIAGMASMFKKDMMAITMTVPGNELYNEEDNAAKVAKHCGLNHYKVPMDEKCIHILPEVLTCIEPLADSSLIPSSYVAQFAGKHLKVMLSGDGGDEMFGGYGLPVRYKREGGGSKNAMLGKMIGYALNKAYTPVFDQVAVRLDTKRMFKWADLDTYFKRNFFPYDLQRKLFKQEAQVVNESLADVYHRSKAFVNNDADALLWVGIQSKMVDDFLLKMDTANMFSSVESRAPLLDHRIAELTMGSTIEELMPNGIDKQMLKEIGEEFIPREVLYDKKKGFSLPIRDYLDRKWLGSLQQMADEGLSAEVGILEPAGIHHIIGLYKRSKAHPLARLLYSILIFEIWLRVFHLQMDPKEVTERYL